LTDSAPGSQARVAALIAFFLLALTVALLFVPGVGWLALIPALAAGAALVWAGAVFASGRSPGDVVRSTDQPELLGPGGPDDPDRPR
jgi:hypothetical protein